jgi:NAD(P)-dependent dehydrogenase (short-subunit alcohol dehydrogenase family)
MIVIGILLPKENGTMNQRESQQMKKTAMVAGVGPGLGASLVRKFAQAGYQVALLARSANYIQTLAQELQQKGAVALAIPTDIINSEQVANSFAQVHEKLGKVDILVNHAGNAVWNIFSELTPEDFESSWRVCALGSFLCCQHAVPDMLERGSGTILFTGATSSIRGRGGAIAFSSAKFAVRGLAWSLARELWPKGIHVAHIIIDGVIDTPDVRERLQPDEGEPLLDPDAIAEAYWRLAQQQRSAWTFELDLRPHDEEFFI